MTLISTILQAPPSLLTQLASSALRALALAGAAGLALAVFRVKAASARLFTWTAVLYAALAMPLLGWLLPPLSVPLPAFLQHGVARPVFSEAQPSKLVAATIPSATENSSTALYNSASISSSSPTSQTKPHTAPPVALTPATSTSSFWRSIQWSAVAAGIYFAVALLLLVRFILGLALGRRLMKTSSQIHDPRVALRLASRAHGCGLAFVPPIAESELISVPVTMGAPRSMILLPASWREWDDAKLDAVVAHEVSHVARRDALMQRLSLLHRALFWFSPLAWWLDWHLTDLAEQASDEAALSCGVDRNHYARTLLEFFEALQAAPGRVWWQGVSMGKAGQAEQRVERILAWRGAVTMGLKKSFAVAVIALALPVIYLAASVRPANQSRVSQGPEIAQNQTPPTPSTTPATPASAPESVSPPSEPAPMNAVPAEPSEPPSPPAPSDKSSYSSSSSSSSGGYSYAYGYDDEQRFVIVTGKTDSLTMSGSTEDIRHVEKLRKQISGDFIWFQRDEKSYIIRDQTTIDRARKFWAPQQELGKKQQELGEQQAALGKQQQELGSRMQQVHVKVPDMTAELDKLRAELKQLSSGATVEQIGHLQSEIGELQSRIGEIQSQAGEQQSELGRQQGALGQQQGSLGAQQGELGRQQGELARQATQKMKELLDEAIAKGIARPEPALL